MEVLNVDELAAQALTGSDAVTALLADGPASVFHDYLPENNRYPAIQYADITESPVLHADNAVLGVSKTIRVTVVDNTQTRRHAIKNAVLTAMKDAGFLWQMTTNTRNGREYYTSIDFYYLYEVNEVN